MLNCIYNTNITNKNFTILKSVRVGKKIKKDIKAHNYDVGNMQKSKCSLKGKNVYFAPDLAYSQRNHLNGLKSELEKTLSSNM